MLFIHSFSAFAIRPDYVSYGHRGRILSLAINEDHSLIASAGDDQEVFVWNFETKTILYKLKGHLTRVVKVAFLSGNRLCSLTKVAISSFGVLKVVKYFFSGLV